MALSTIRVPRLTRSGVAFTVCVDYVHRNCVIKFDALAKLAELQSGAADPLVIFHAYQGKICGVARRLVAANVQNNPLQIGPQYFQ